MAGNGRIYHKKLNTVNTEFRCSTQTDGVANSFHMMRKKPKFKMKVEEMLQEKQTVSDRNNATIAAKLEEVVYQAIVGLDPGNVLMVGGARFCHCETERIKWPNKHVRHNTGELNRQRKPHLCTCRPRNS